MLREERMYEIALVVVCVALFSHNVAVSEEVTTAPTETIRLPKGCIESICGSIVSKCLLTQSCKCGPDPVQNNITCARDCFFCLDGMYTECCSCVDVCRKDTSDSVSLGQKSNVEDLPEPMTELFQMLMENAASSQGRWTSISFPAHQSVLGLNKDLHFVRIQTVDKNSSEEAIPPIALHPPYELNNHPDDVNCTVSFLNSCLSLNKCRENCISLGASSYRWFHDGCCECVGSTCLNYGLNEGRCQLCPISKDLLKTAEADEEIIIQSPEALAKPPVIVPVDQLNAVSASEASNILVHPSTSTATPSPPTVVTTADPLGNLQKSDDNNLL